MKSLFDLIMFAAHELRAEARLSTYEVEALIQLGEIIKANVEHSTSLDPFGREKALAALKQALTE